MSEMFGRIGGPRDEAKELEAGIELGPHAPGARWLRRHIVGSVGALTTVLDGAYRAATITGYMLVSIEPPQILVSIELDSQMEGWLLESRVFGLSLLPWNQQFLADRFAGFAPLASTRFHGIEHFVAVTGAPLLSVASAWADCEVIEDFETGDHRSFVGHIVALGRGEGPEDDPLIYYLSRYRRLGSR